MVLAQLLPAQGSDQGPGWITGREDRYRRRVTELLLAVPTRDLATGWQLARDLGRPVAPLLWEMLRAEKSNVDRRLVLLAAAVLAGGPGEDETLFRWLRQQKPMLEERILAGMLLALGPRRKHPMDDYWSACLGPSKTPETLLGIAARLGAARFPATAARAPNPSGDDPGLLAAAAFAGLPISAVQAARMWHRPVRNADLFWRGALLGERWRLAIEGTAPTLLDQAKELLAGREDQHADARAAAMLLLARAGVLDPTSQRPDWQLLQLAASQLQSPAVLRDWLQPAPLPRDDQPQRLAVAYALMQPVGVIVAARDVWANDPRIRSQLALALAIRLLSAPSQDTIRVELPDVPEWRLVVWASGGDFVAPASWPDERLTQLGRLVAAGRADRLVVRAVLEDTLWRWGCHPGISAWEQERLLVRDLMLAGSKRGGGQYLPHLRTEERYFPTGLDRSDEFFSIAVTLYEFLGRPTLPMPVEYRLR